MGAKNVRQFLGTTDVRSAIFYIYHSGINRLKHCLESRVKHFT